MAHRVAKNIVHLHLTPEQALAWAQGKEIDPKIEDHFIPKKKKRAATEGCNACLDLLFHTFDRLLCAAEAGRGTRRPRQVIRQAGNRWTFGFFCPPELFGKERTAAVKRHLRYCTVCRKELAAFKKLIRA